MGEKLRILLAPRPPPLLTRPRPLPRSPGIFTWKVGIQKWASLQNVAGLDNMLSGHTPQVVAGLRNFGAEARKSGAEVESLSQH